MSGEDDFFSVARTIPLVATGSSQRPTGSASRTDIPLIPSEVTPWLTAFRAYSVTCQRLWRYMGSMRAAAARGAYQSVPAFRCATLASTPTATMMPLSSYLGEKVVSENEYLSAMAKYGIGPEQDGGDSGVRKVQGRGRGREMGVSSELDEAPGTIDGDAAGAKTYHVCTGPKLHSTHPANSVPSATSSAVIATVSPRNTPSAA
jgi:hypothetical protein